MNAPGIRPDVSEQRLDLWRAVGRLPLGDAGLALALLSFLNVAGLEKAVLVLEALRTFDLR